MPKAMSAIPGEGLPQSTAYGAIIVIQETFHTEVSFVSEMRRDRNRAGQQGL